MAECVVTSCCNALLGFSLVRRDSLVEVKLGGFIKFASNSEFHKQAPSWWWSFQSRFNSVAKSTSETSLRSVAECSRADSPPPTLARQVFVQKRPSRPNVTGGDHDSSRTHPGMYYPFTALRSKLIHQGNCKVNLICSLGCP